MRQLVRHGSINSTAPNELPRSPSRADHLFAARAATEAGQLLVGLRERLVAGGAGAAELRTEGDRQSHELLMGLFADVVPADAVLSEEGAANPARLDADRVWIVDPLDGTREFSEPPRTDWAVHVALVIDGTPVAGAVALPALGVTLATADPPPAPSPMTGRPRIVVSRSRPPAHAQLLADSLDGELVEMGSAGAKAMAVLRGEVDVYAHAGGQYEWDSAAPVAVAAASGLHVSRVDGSPLRYNRPNPYLPDLLVCRPELADQVIRVMATAG